MQSVEIKKTVLAWQWNGEQQGLPDGFHLCRPEVHYSSGRELVYFTYADLPTRQWIGMRKLEDKPVSNPMRGTIEVTLKDGKNYYRECFPFAFYSVKSEASTTGDHRARFLDKNRQDDIDAFVDFADIEGWWDEAHGDSRVLKKRLEYRVIDGSYGRGYRPYYLKPTDWLIKDGDSVEVVSAEKFREAHG